MKRQVVLVFRKPNSYSNSIEYLFHSIYQVVKDRIDVKEYQLPNFSLGFWNRIRNVLSIFRCRKKIIHITGDTYYVVLGGLFCKRIMTIHDLSFLTRTRGIKRSLLKLFWVTLPVTVAHKITVVSNFTKEALLKETNISQEKIKVIYNFIDPIYRPVQRIFNETNPSLLQIGADFNKNIENLVASLEGIKCTLVIIGKLSNSQINLLKTAKINYQNRYLLSIEELHQEYLKADLLTFISTIEGFGMPILEAQATGLPVVTSNCSSMPEVAGKGAVLVNPFNTERMRQGILEIISSREKRKEMIREGYKNVKRFSIEKVAEDYLKVYQEIDN